MNYSYPNNAPFTLKASVFVNLYHPNIFRMCTIKTDLHMSVDTTASMHCDIGRIMDIMTVNIQVCYTHSDNIQCDFDFEH